MLARILLLLALVLPGSSRAAMVTVQQCDPVTVDGQLLNRLTLALASPNYTTTVRLYVQKPMVHADTCHVVSFTGPAGWSASLLPDGGAIAFSAIDGGLTGGAPVGGFQLVLSHTTACVRFVFHDPFGDGGSTETCFQDCLVTPTLPSSWGRIKTRYR